ncbi:heat shock factor protein 1 isoform X1 [Polypterus senegalus]|uniref:heat shock factor protein 1 isoform X1 n=1 Tax=Polypterus senegalus TaxID=55291 RepID=UPI0019644C7C|nr:heat shock factor protein 1 isoform X1 [Polypterus senegalus]
MDMDLQSGGLAPSSGGILNTGGSNVPAFLTKLWTLVEDPETDSMICWSLSGNSFHVFDQGHFAKDVLPKYFKHNNMASFVRQLNMYGFRKVVHIEQGGLVKPEKDDTEFQHPYFVRGQEHLLENIKRKVTNVSNIKHEDVKVRQDDISKILTDVHLLRGKQESMDSKLIAMKHENEALWREVASLRQKHAQQQKVVNKLLQFLISLVQSNRVLGVKRKLPLMLNDSSTAHSLPKYSRQFSLEHLQGSSAFNASSQQYTGTDLYSSDSPVNSGPIISDVTDVAQSSPSSSSNVSTDEITSQPVQIKEEPASPVETPQIEEASPVNVSVEDPLSPTTFIDSILQENAPSESAAGTSATVTETESEEKCLSVACLDNLTHSSQMSEVTCVVPSPSSSSLCPRAQQGSELNDHLETIDSNLDSLQAMLSGQSISFDSSQIFDIFGSSLSPPDFSLPDLDTSLASIHDLLTQDQKSTESNSNTTDTGKQLIQYTAQPLFLLDPSSTEASGGDLPVLFELEDDSYFSSGNDSEDPTASLLSETYQPKAKDPALS